MFGYRSKKKKWSHLGSGILPSLVPSGWILGGNGGANVFIDEKGPRDGWGTEQGRFCRELLALLFSHFSKYSCSAIGLVTFQEVFKFWAKLATTIVVPFLLDRPIIFHSVPLGKTRG